MVCVRRPPGEPVKRTWREKPSDEAVETAILDFAKGYSTGAYPSEDEFLGAARGRLGPEVTRQQVRDALNLHPHLKGRRGYPSTKI